jgi:hypothetical protein
LPTTISAVQQSNTLAMAKAHPLEAGDALRLLSRIRMNVARDEKRCSRFRGVAMPMCKRMSSPPAGSINPEIPIATRDPVDQRRVRLVDHHAPVRSAHHSGQSQRFGGRVAWSVSTWHRKGQALVLNLAALWAWQPHEKSKWS